MSTAKVVGSVKENGKLLSVTLQLTDPKEIQVFRAFLKDEPAIASCPACRCKTEVTDSMMVLCIESPLGNTAGLQMAHPIINCAYCGRPLVENSMDYSAFPSVVSFITSLRNRYVQLKQKGSVTNG